MTYVIKSNATLENTAAAVGNIHNFDGASDYRAMLDFSNNIYKVNGDFVGINDAINVSRSTIATYKDIFGNTKIAASNQPRVGYFKDYDSSGLIVERAITNVLTSQSDASAFTLPNSTESACISWEGVGTASLVASGITLAKESEFGGRKYKFYTRTGAVTGTISITGNVKDISVHNGSNAYSYIPPSTTKNVEMASLAGSAKALATSKDITIITRTLLPVSHATILGNYIALANSKSPQGAIFSVGLYNPTAVSASDIFVLPDGAGANNQKKAGGVAGTTPTFAVEALVSKNYGAEVAMLSRGQVTKNTTANIPAVPPTGMTDIYLANVPSGIVTSRFYGGVITHCIVYDRALTDRELLNLSFFGN